MQNTIHTMQPPQVHHCPWGAKVHCKTKRSPPSSSLFLCRIGVQSALQNITHKMQPPQLIPVHTLYRGSKHVAKHRPHHANPPGSSLSLGCKSALQNKAQPPKFIAVPVPDRGAKHIANYHQQNATPGVHRCSSARSGCKARCKTPPTKCKPPKFIALPLPDRGAKCIAKHHP